MNRTLTEILKRREDISDYLFHFTKGVNAKDTLISIITQKKIKDTKGSGYICFSESPLTMLSPMFSFFKQWDSPMYAPYGIGVKKDYLYQLGGKPVIYGDSYDFKILPEELKWRFVQYSPGENDFTWLREWRLPLPSLELSYENCFFIVDTNSDFWGMQELFMDLNDIDVDAEPEDGGIRTTYFGYFSRKYKVISLEEISKLASITKNQLLNILESEKEEEGVFLGSTWE